LPAGHSLTGGDRQCCSSPTVKVVAPPLTLRLEHIGLRGGQRARHHCGRLRGLRQGGQQGLGVQRGNRAWGYRIKGWGEGCLGGGCLGGGVPGGRGAWGEGCLREVAASAAALQTLRAGGRGSSKAQGRGAAGRTRRSSSDHKPAKKVRRRAASCAPPGPSSRSTTPGAARSCCTFLVPAVWAWPHL
jgi:hypothetical protein